MFVFVMKMISTVFTLISLEQEFVKLNNLIIFIPFFPVFQTVLLLCFDINYPDRQPLRKIPQPVNQPNLA